MIAVFHSPVIGQAGCNSAVAAIASVAASKFKKRVLVLQLRDNVTPIEKILFNRELESKSIKNEENNFEQAGIDALLARVGASKMKKEDFENFAVNTITQNDNLTIIGATKKTSIEAELETASYSNVVQLLDNADTLGSYDWIFVSAPSTNSNFTQVLLNSQNLNILSVICVPQNMMIIKREHQNKRLDGLFSKKTSDISTKTCKKCMLIGNFDVDSKYSPRNIAAGYGYRQDKICSILHDAHYKDALSQGDLYNFIMKNLENDIDDDIYSFSKYLVEATGKILTQDIRDMKVAYTKIVYTEPLPSKDSFEKVDTSLKAPDTSNYEAPDDDDDDIYLDDPDDDLYDDDI